jgi:hypothetical protein
MANPNMKKGAPSVNPKGRAASVEKAAGTKHAPGSSGVIAYGGIVSTSGERSSDMIGRQKWITYANAPIRSAPVAIAYLLRNALFGGVKWSLVENEAGGKAAKKGLDVVQRGLLDARMPTPWRAVMPKALNGNYFGGFSIHATAMARRKDGLVTYTEIEHRPQHTIYQWLRKSPTDPFTDVIQRIDDGNTYPISLADCFYLRNNAIADGPEGQGVLRLICERIRQTDKYRGLEGTELFSSMGGTPIARAPLEEIAAGASGKTESEMATYIDNATQAIEDAVSSRIKNPSEQQYLKLDSKTYQGSDPNTISTVPKWGIEIVKGDLQGLEPIRKVITDNELDDARILGVEFCFIGGGDTKGTFSAHESKVGMFAAQLSADVDLGAEQGTQQVCRPLVAANGLDPDEACPTLVASPIGTDDVEKTCRALGLLNMAGLTPNHPAKRVIFDRMSLPWQDEPELVLPRAFAPPPPAPSGDPNQGNPTGAPARVEPAPTDVAPQEQP